MISISNLCHRHPDQPRDLLRDLNLRLEAGQSLALLGRSGSGKSSLLNLIAGIDTVQHGSLRVDSVEMNGLSDRQRTLYRRQHVGLVYQSFNLLPTLTVSQNLSVPLALNDVPASESQSRISDWLSHLQLADKANRFPDTLSGGEQQRVAIVRALIHRPRLVLADEPTGSLDAQAGELALDLLLRGTQQQAQTLFLVTHSRAVAQRCDLVLSLREGTLHPGTEGMAW